MQRSHDRELWNSIVCGSDTDDDLGPVTAQKRANRPDLLAQQYYLATATASAKTTHVKEEGMDCENTQDEAGTYDHGDGGTRQLFSDTFGGSGSPVKDLEDTQSVDDIDTDTSCTVRADDESPNDSFILPSITYKRKRGLELPRKTSAMVHSCSVMSKDQQSEPNAVKEVAEILEMPAEDRKTTLQQSYAGLYMPLEKMTLPQIYLENKEAAGDVLAHFINNTTFVCTVWLNYDKVEKKFFDDERRQYCGKPRLSAKARTTIKQLEEAGHYLRNMRLVLSTAWNSLAQIDITFDKEAGYIVEPALDTEVHSHACLKRFITTMAGRLQRELATYNAQALSLDDLDLLAAYFCRSAPPEQRDGVFSMPSEWMQPEEGFREWWDHDEKFRRLKWAYDNRRSKSRYW